MCKGLDFKTFAHNNFFEKIVVLNKTSKQKQNLNYAQKSQY